MVTEKYTHGGQNVTTHYAKTGTPVATEQNVSTNYTPPSGRSKEEKLATHLNRREENRAIRDSETGGSYTKGNKRAIQDYDDAPALAKGERKPLQKKKQPPYAGGGIGNVFAGVGSRFTDLTQSLPKPDWLTPGTGGKGKKGKFSSVVPGSNVPDWVLTGRMPYDAPTRSTQKQVARTIVTHIHEDGTRTRTVRVPTQKKPKNSRPGWITW